LKQNATNDTTTLIKQYVPGQRWKTIILMTCNLTDLIFDDSFYLCLRKIDVQ